MYIKAKNSRYKGIQHLIKHINAKEEEQMDLKRFFKRVIFSALLSLILVVFLTACGTKVKGEYVADTGGVLVNFKSGGIVEINGTPYPYELKGKSITIKEGNGRDEVMIVNDDGTLQTNAFGMNIILRKKK